MLSEADVKAMTDEALYEALGLIKQEIRVREEDGFADAVRDHLREQPIGALRDAIAGGEGAVEVGFPVTRWDNGYFYDERNGLVVLADGSTVRVDFSASAVSDGLTELSGIARREEEGLGVFSELKVDLITGRVQHL